MDLIEYRQHHGPNAWHELADKVGTSHAYISQLAHGFRRPSPKMTTRLVRATNGELTHVALRPDIYGALDQSIA